MSNHSNQEDEDPRDPATRAFDALRDELARVRQSMEDLRAGIQQSRPHDYRRTLGEILRVQEGVEAELHALKARPAIQYTPESFSQEMERERTRLVENDRREIRDTINGLDDTLRKLKKLLETTFEDYMIKWMIIAAGFIGILFGSIFCFSVVTFLAGLAPESLKMPEDIASHILGLPMQDAGVRLIYRDNPNVWDNIIYINNIMRNNYDAIDKCKKEATYNKKEVKCLIGGLKDLTQREQKTLHSAFCNLIHVSDDHSSDLVQVLCSAALLHRRLCPLENIA